MLIWTHLIRTSTNCTFSLCRLCVLTVLSVYQILWGLMEQTNKQTKQKKSLIVFRHIYYYFIIILGNFTFLIFVFISAVWKQHFRPKKKWMLTTIWHSFNLTILTAVNERSFILSFEMRFRRIHTPYMSEEDGIRPNLEIPWPIQSQKYLRISTDSIFHSCMFRAAIWTK